jgi:hypothetical protein
VLGFLSTGYLPCTLDDRDCILAYASSSASSYAYRLVLFPIEWYTKPCALEADLPLFPFVDALHADDYLHLSITVHEYEHVLMLVGIRASDSCECHISLFDRTSLSNFQTRSLHFYTQSSMACYEQPYEWCLLVPETNVLVLCAGDTIRWFPFSSSTSSSANRQPKGLPFFVEERLSSRTLMCAYGEPWVEKTRCGMFDIDRFVPRFCQRLDDNEQSTEKKSNHSSRVEDYCTSMIAADERAVTVLVGVRLESGTDIVAVVEIPFANGGMQAGVPLIFGPFSNPKISSSASSSVGSSSSSGGSSSSSSTCTVAVSIEERTRMIASGFRAEWKLQQGGFLNSSFASKTWSLSNESLFTGCSLPYVVHPSGLLVLDAYNHVRS